MNKKPKKKLSRGLVKHKKAKAPKKKIKPAVKKRKTEVKKRKTTVKKRKTAVKKRKPAVKKRKHATSLVRAEKNPIISPNPENNWEAWQTFNPGVVLLEDKVHFLYRAIGEDGISRFGYAVSVDGIHIDERLPYPVYEHKLTRQVFNYHSFASGGSFGGAEDPRLVRVNNEDVLYMTYTSCDGGLRVGLTSIKVDDFLNKKWRWKTPALISPPGEVHKNWLIFPEKINQGINSKYAILHSIKPNIQIEYVDSLEFDDADYINSFHGGGPQKRCWDKWLRGAGAPPVKTRLGWLLFYHAMDNDWSKYKVGAMLLDLKDPTKVLYRAREPVLEPSEHYENNGYKGGVVYVSGAIVKDGNLFVYYGAADSFVSVAYAPLEEFLNALTRGKNPKLSVKKLSKEK